jgi:hypothetical protein
MNDFGKSAFDAEMGPYTQGFALTRYLAHTYGDSIVPQVWRTMSSWKNWSLGAALEQTIGISDDSLYAGWKRSLRETYAEQKKQLGTLVQGDTVHLKGKGFYQDLLQFSGGKLWGLSNLGAPFFEGGLFCDTAEYKKFKVKKPYLTQGFSVRAPDSGSPLLAYTHYQNRDRKGRLYFDISVIDTAGKETPITQYADAVFPDLSPDLKTVVFVRRENNSTRFVLSAASIDAGEKRAGASPSLTCTRCMPTITLTAATDRRRLLLEARRAPLLIRAAHTGA